MSKKKKNKNDELRLEQECRQMALKFGCILAKIENNGYTGIPDDLFISHDGSHVFLLEFKNGTHGRLSAEQKVWLARYPTVIHIIRSIDDFVNFLHTFG